MGRALATGISKSYRGLKETQREQIIASFNGVSNGYFYNFLSFNYTFVLDNCVDAVKNKKVDLGVRTYNGVGHMNKIKNLIHVHGTVNEAMALGVNDDSQIADNSLFEGQDSLYKDQIIKQNTNKNNESNTDEKALELLNSSDYIYIYGMSIGETDKLWWKRICDLMIRKKNVHVILHSYDAPKEEIIRTDYLLYCNEKKREFISYGEVGEENGKDLMDRIHIDNTNVFSDMKDIVKNNETSNLIDEMIMV